MYVPRKLLPERGADVHALNVLDDEGEAPYQLEASLAARYEVIAGLLRVQEPVALRKVRRNPFMAQTPASDRHFRF